MRIHGAVLPFLLLALLASTASDAEAQGRRKGRRPPGAPPPDAFERAGPDLGDPAPDLVLRDLEGEEVRLSGLWSERPLVLVLGSLTCPAFRGGASGLNRIAEGYPDQVSVAILYTLEAHPNGAKSPYADGEWVPPVNGREGIEQGQPADLEGRREAARRAVERLRLRARVLVDGMDDAGWKAFGPAPNNAFLIDRSGTVVARQAWFDPEAMEGDLRLLLDRDAPRAAPAPAGPAPPGGR